MRLDENYDDGDNDNDANDNFDDDQVPLFMMGTILQIFRENSSWIIYADF